MFKLLPDAVHRLGRRMASGTVEQRLKGMQITQELELTHTLKDNLLMLSSHANAKVRSRAIGMVDSGDLAIAQTLLDRALKDTDPRVRANAIEALEAHCKDEFIPLLANRARLGHNRERANAIKALHRLRVGAALEALMNMLHDERAEHRISALWVLKRMSSWKMLGEVGRLAKSDPNARVRRYALALLKSIQEMVQDANRKAAS